MLIHVTPVGVVYDPQCRDPRPVLHLLRQSSAPATSARPHSDRPCIYWQIDRRANSGNPPPIHWKFGDTSWPCSMASRRNRPRSTRLAFSLMSSSCGS